MCTPCCILFKVYSYLLYGNWCFVLEGLRGVDAFSTDMLQSYNSINKPFIK